MNGYLKANDTLRMKATSFIDDVVFKESEKLGIDPVNTMEMFVAAYNYHKAG